MKISIIGHGHLAYITAACMEQFHKVNVDDDKVGDSEVIWVCYDTPVDSDGKPNSDVIFERLGKVLCYAKEKTIVLISTQVPVGTCTKLQTLWPNLVIICSPENLRRGKGIHDFMNPERIVIGGSAEYFEKIDELFKPIKTNKLWMNLESAEMVKHALNSFLACSIAFINEIDAVCKAVGAEPKLVADGLQSDKRIGALSYLRPGGPYTNDTLGREIHTLIDIDNKMNIGLKLIPSIKKSNDEHINNRK
jgi:UDPglucose 6-dehydrogenase